MKLLDFIRAADPRARKSDVGDTVFRLLAMHETLAHCLIREPRRVRPILAAAGWLPRMAGDVDEVWACACVGWMAAESDEYGDVARRVRLASRFGTFGSRPLANGHERADADYHERMLWESVMRLGDVERIATTTVPLAVGIRRDLMVAERMAVAARRARVAAWRAIGAHDDEQQRQVERREAGLAAFIRRTKRPRARSVA